MNLFRGYIRTNGKAATEPFKNLPDEELRTFAGAKNLNSYAGVLSEDTILLDVDDHDESEIFMQIVEEKQLLCRVYETKRGKHFYFKRRNFRHCKPRKKSGKAIYFFYAEIKKVFNSYLRTVNFQP